MSERDRTIRWNQKEDLIDEVKQALGMEPAGLRQVIAVLAHPDVIKQTLEYFRSHDTTHVCTHFEAPWDCRRDSESNYKSIEYGWISSPSTRVIPGNWCQPCRRRALGEEPSDLPVYVEGHISSLSRTWLDEDDEPNPSGTNNI